MGSVFSVSSLISALIMALCLAGIGFGIDRLFNNKHIKYRKNTFKVGDHVDFARDSYTDAEILEIDGDEFVVKTKIHRNDLFKKRTK